MEFPWSYKVSAVVGRGRIKLVDDGGPVQRAQVDVGPEGYGVRDETPVVGWYGLAARPPVDSDCIVLFAGGDRSDGVVIATSNQTWRLKNLGDGDVGLYDTRGQQVWLKSDKIVVTSPTLVEIDAPAIHLGAGATKAVALDGDPVIGGSVHASSTVVKAL